MKTFLKILWGIAKVIIAFFLFITAISITFNTAEGWWLGPIIALIGMLFHWRFWIIAIPALIIGAKLSRMGK